jgi:hypothetical protein
MTQPLWTLRSNGLCCAVLQGPALPAADAIIYCTGYRYKFPFLEQCPDTAGLSGQQHVPGATIVTRYLLSVTIYLLLVTSLVVD